MMASSSHTKYDVFISFRGTDVRSGLLSHLKVSLKQHKIDFYVDEDKLEKGDEISPSLLTAIDESLMSLVIFSKDYASSKWCLEELVKIMECKQTVIPVFYNTDPSHVRHQIGSYKDAFTKHEERCTEKVQVWRSALKSAADLSGFHSSNYKDEAELIEQITKSLFTRLNMLMCPSTLRNLVGIEKKIDDLQSLMKQNSQDVCVIGIWGMGGIGKTTLATAVFYRFQDEYEGSCFLENVREESQKHGGVIDLKNKLFSSLLKEKKLQIDTSNELPFHVERKLRRTKVLIVLDDINDLSQIENLVGELNCYGSGSRIIITTRDKDMLKDEAIKTYEVLPLTSEEELELFNLNAFGNSCRATEFHGLSSKVIEYTRELPLAVKVLGSFLRGKNKEEWESQLDKLKKKPFKKIHDVLKLSYDNLDRQQKNVFLYIACCFKGYTESSIINVLDKCDFSIAVELKVLSDKALITRTLEEESIFVSMHDLLEEMGKEIVREEQMEDPSKWRHLWDFHDIQGVLENEKGTEHIQSIAMDEGASRSILCSSSRVFSRMQKLKILRIPPKSVVDLCLIKLPKGLESLPNELRLLDWEHYPLRYLPSTFCAKNLVELYLPHSKLERLWDGVMPIENLKIIDLCWSKYLVELPDLSLAKSLEEVLLVKCENLRVIHPSIFSLPKLEKLDLTLCISLTRLQCAIPLESLSYLVLSDCDKLMEFSVKSRKMIELDLSYTDIKYLPLFVGCLRRIEKLILYGCLGLIEVSRNLVHLSSLRSLDISGCSQLLYLPKLPPSIVELWASHCTSLESLQFTSLNKNFASIWLIDCMRLDGHSQQSIRLIARLSLTTFARKSPKERKSLRDYGIESKFMYPDSKVPKWFKHRTQQGIITITPHSKLLGFIFCMILFVTQSLRVDWFLETDDGERLNLFDMGGHTVDDSWASLDYLKTHHAFIYYAECNVLINERIEESRAKFQNPKLSFEFYDCEMDMSIRKCGVYPVYSANEDEEEEEEEDDDHDDDDEDEEEEEEFEMGKRSQRSGDNHMDELEVVPPSKRREF